MPPSSIIGTAIDDDLGMSLSTIRLRPTPPLAPSDRRRGEILDPDAGMEQLGLMPGHDQGTLGTARGVERRSGADSPCRSRNRCAAATTSWRTAARSTCALRPWKS